MLADIDPLDAMTFLAVGGFVLFILIGLLVGLTAGWVDDHEQNRKDRRHESRRDEFRRRDQSRRDE